MATASPEEKRWIDRFRKLCQDMPPSVWVFVASGTPHVMARDGDGHRVYLPRSGGVDPSKTLASMQTRRSSWDGGDW